MFVLSSTRSLHRGWKTNKAEVAGDRKTKVVNGKHDMSWWQYVSSSQNKRKDGDHSEPEQTWYPLIKCYSNEESAELLRTRNSTFKIMSIYSFVLHFIIRPLHEDLTKFMFLERLKKWRDKTLTMSLVSESEGLDSEGDFSFSLGSP